MRTPPRRTGFRLGPMVFVPELRTDRRNDPWAHRKGEPRPFALLWAVYLMAAALLTIFAVSRVSIPSAAQFVYACRAMIVMANVGAVVLWPMTRLSQEFPARPLRAAFVDLLIVIVPVQAIIWPMWLLTQWSWEVTGAQAASAASWACLTGSVVLLATAGASNAWRTLWMGVCLLFALAAPALLILPGLFNIPTRADVLMWFSPLTTPYLISASPSGLAPTMTRQEWLMVLWPLPVAAALWLAGAARCQQPAPGGGAVDPRTPSR